MRAWSRIKVPHRVLTLLMGPTVVDTVTVAEAVADPSSCSFMDCISAVECFMEDTLFTGVGVQALLQVLLLVSEADMLRKVTAAAATLEDVC